MYHPAAALHQPSLRDALLADFKRLAEFLERTPAEPIPPAEEPKPATQPTLF
jgi:hypothetical protein